MLNSIITETKKRMQTMDNVPNSFSKVPTIRQWAKVCVAVFGYLMSERSNDNNHLASLAANLDLDMKFSDA